MPARRLLICGLVLLSCAPGWAGAQAVAAAGEPPAAPAPAPAPAPDAGAALKPAANATASGQELMTFCVPQWRPFSICSPDEPSSTYTGHDVELVRGASKRLGLMEGVDFRFLCTNFSTMIDSLTVLGGPCTASVTGVTITSEREAKGIKFTYPTLKASLGIMVESSHQSTDGWGFTRPFSWSLWLALLLTLLVVPPLIFLIEFWSLRRHIHRDDIRPGVMESTWRSALTLMLFDSFAVSSWGARVAVLTFMFLALLTTSTYTANLAAFVTVSSIQSSIRSVADLRGKAVGTSPIYIDRLKKYGIQATPYPFNKDTDYLEWRDLVASGELAALIRDMPPLMNLANTAPNCEVTLLDDMGIEPFDYGIAFHANSTDRLVEAWSRAVLLLQEEGTLEALKDSWIMSETSGCQTFNQMNKGADSVSFKDLSGLWWILLGGFILGALLMLGQRTLRRRKKQKELDPDAKWLRYEPASRFLNLVSAVGVKKRRLGGRSASAASERSAPASARSSARRAKKGAAAAGLPGAPGAESPAPGSDGKPETPPRKGADDIESQVSGNGPSPASANGPPAGSPPQPSPEEAAAARSATLRHSVLQTVESVYAAQSWKSRSASQTPRSGA